MSKFRTQNRPYGADGQPNSYFSDTTSESSEEPLEKIANADFNNSLGGNNMMAVFNAGQDNSTLDNGMSAYAELIGYTHGASRIEMDQDLAGIGAHLSIPTGVYPAKIDDASLGMSNISDNTDYGNGEYGMVGDNGGLSISVNGNASLMANMELPFSTPTRNGQDIAPLNLQDDVFQQYGDISDNISPHTLAGNFTSDDMLHGTAGFGDFIPQNQDQAFRLNEEDVMGSNANNSFTEDQFMAQMNASNRRVTEQGDFSEDPRHADAPTNRFITSSSRRSGSNIPRNAGVATTPLTDNFGLPTNNTGHQTKDAAATSFETPLAHQDQGTTAGSSMYNHDARNCHDMEASFMYQNSQTGANQSASSSFGGSQLQLQSTGSPSLQGSFNGNSKSSNKSDGCDSPYVEDEELSEDEAPSRKRKRGADKKGKGRSTSTNVAAINKDGQRRKPRAPRPPLRKWADKDLSLALLGIVWACGESGLQIPFDQAAQLVDINCTAGALQQAILKLHEAGVEIGLQLPKIRMHWTKKPNSTTTSTRDPTSRPRRKPTLRQLCQAFIITLKRAYVEEDRIMLPRPYTAGLTGCVPMFGLDSVAEAKDHAAGSSSAGPANEDQSMSLTVYKPNFPEVFAPKAPANTGAKRQSGNKGQSNTKGQSNNKAQYGANAPSYTKERTQTQGYMTQTAQDQNHGCSNYTTRLQTQGYFDQDTQGQPQGYFNHGNQGYMGQGNQAFMDQGTHGYTDQGTQDISSFNQHTAATFTNYDQSTSNGYVQPYEYSSTQQSFGFGAPDALTHGFSTSPTEQAFPQQQLQAETLVNDQGQDNWEWPEPLDDGNDGGAEEGEPMNQNTWFDMDTFYTDKGV